MFNCTHRWDPKSFYNSGSVFLEVITMKGYSTFPKALKLEPHQFGVISRTFVGGWV